MHDVENYNTYDNEEWLALKTEFQNLYRDGGVLGLRLGIMNKRQAIYSTIKSRLLRIQSLELKICDIFDYL